MQGFFYGWYLKCQSNTQTLAVIPAIHEAAEKQSCSIQIITAGNAWNIDFPIDAFRRAKKNIIIDKNQFSDKGIRLTIHTQELNVTGKLKFGPLSPLRYDIMGPFSLIPFLECRHMVWSMQHAVSGTLHINGQKYSFQNAKGYWEGDQGRSFPKEYAWTQCFFEDGSLMLSVADIPMAGFHFTGIICVILWKGKEYRLATYLGAKAVEIQNGTIQIIQDDLELEARLLEKAGRPLKAPTNGDMVRTIQESAACRAFYRLQKGSHTLFAFETDMASFEYEYD